MVRIALFFFSVPDSKLFLLEQKNNYLVRLHIAVTWQERIEKVKQNIKRTNQVLSKTIFPADLTNLEDIACKVPTFAVV